MNVGYAALFGDQSRELRKLSWGGYREEDTLLGSIISISDLSLLFTSNSGLGVLNLCHVLLFIINL